MSWFQQWWQGKYIPPKNDRSDIIFVMGHYERHWTSSLAHVVMDFYMREWEWVWSVVLALVTGLKLIR